MREGLVRLVGMRIRQVKVGIVCLLKMALSPLCFCKGAKQLFSMQDLSLGSTNGGGVSALAGDLAAGS